MFEMPPVWWAYLQRLPRDECCSEDILKVFCCMTRDSNALEGGHNVLLSKVLTFNEYTLQNTTKVSQCLGNEVYPV